MSEPQGDLEYFAFRAAMERTMSETAPETSIARIHSELAERYQSLANGLNQPRPSVQAEANG